MTNKFFLHLLVILLGACIVKSQHSETLNKNDSKKNFYYNFNSVYGYDIKEGVKPDAYPLLNYTKEDSIFTLDEKNFEIKKWVVSYNDEILYDLIMHHFPNDDHYSNSADEIYLKSKRLRNKDGIGVGSTLEELTSKYPNIKLFYHPYDGFFLESHISNIQFYLDANDYLHFVQKDSDLTEVDLNKIPSHVKVKYIKMYPFNFDDDVSDFLGKWNDEQNKIYTILKENEEYFLIKDKTQKIELINIDNDFYSYPTHPENIIITIEDDFQIAMQIQNANAEEIILESLAPDFSEGYAFIENFDDDFVYLYFLSQHKTENNTLFLKDIDNKIIRVSLGKEEFMNCNGSKKISIDEIYSDYLFTPTTVDLVYFVKIENGRITTLYAEKCKQFEFIY